VSQPIDEMGVVEMAERQVGTGDIASDLREILINLTRDPSLFDIPEADKAKARDVWALAIAIRGSAHGHCSRDLFNLLDEAEEAVAPVIPVPGEPADAEDEEVEDDADGERDEDTLT
jgi:hypothetical protein